MDFRIGMEIICKTSLNWLNAYFGAKSLPDCKAKSVRNDHSVSCTESVGSKMASWEFSENASLNLVNSYCLEIILKFKIRQQKIIWNYKMEAQYCIENEIESWEKIYKKILKKLLVSSDMRLL